MIYLGRKDSQVKVSNFIPTTLLKRLSAFSIRLAPSDWPPHGTSWGDSHYNANIGYLLELNLEGLT